jgi:DNA-binding NarL/FixJ family response regulator
MKKTGQIKKRNILIVDDDPLCRSFVKLTLELELKISPMVAPHAEAALAILASEPIYVLITDLKMPKMDGIELLEKVKKDFPGVEVIMMSSDFGPIAPDSIVEAGARAAFLKDQIHSEMLPLVRNLLNFRALEGVSSYSRCEETYV